MTFPYTHANTPIANLKGTYQKKNVHFFLPKQSVTCTCPWHDEFCPHQLLVQKWEENTKPMLMDLERQVSGWENIVVPGEVLFLRGL